MFESTQFIGLVIDEKYQIKSLLGQGGMGAVYLALHLGTTRLVAVKVIAPQFMTNQHFVERFKREAQATGQLRHPNVVNITDFGFSFLGQKRVAYLVMEYLDGCSLADLLKKKGHLSLELTVEIVEQICSAIDKAHQQGIIHRVLSLIIFG
ncbi:MAG: serine/threonine protein kinase [Blastocatellia bacterium]|nr:serine/threonine protein kinase [Blastocatellia bacterium]